MDIEKMDPGMDHVYKPELSPNGPNVYWTCSCSPKRARSALSLARARKAFEAHVKQSRFVALTNDTLKEEI